MITALALLGAAGAFPACTRGLETIPGTEALPGSAEEAQRRLDGRLAKTTELKLKFRKSIQALNQADAFFTDLANAITVKTDSARNPARAFDELIRALREALQETTRGLVDQKADGSWVIERELALSFRKYASPACHTTRVRIHGHRVEGRDQADVTFQDCLTPEAVVVARADIGAAGPGAGPGESEMHLAFYPKNLEVFLPTAAEVRGNRCGITGGAAEIILACDEVYFGGTDWGGVVRPFEIRHGARGVSATISSSVAVVLGGSGHAVLEADAVLTAVPGQPTQLQVGLRKP